MKKSQKLAEVINGMTYKEWEAFKQFIEAEYGQLRNSNVLTVDERMLRNLSQFKDR